MYGELGALLRRWVDHGLLDLPDPEATAAVLLASLTYFPILRDLIGRTPGDIDPHRFLDAWVDHAARTLSPPTP